MYTAQARSLGMAAAEGGRMSQPWVTRFVCCAGTSMKALNQSFNPGSDITLQEWIIIFGAIQLVLSQVRLNAILVLLLIARLNIIDRQRGC